MSDFDLPATVADLVAHPENPRVISDEARQGLHASMEELGDISGITVNLRGGAARVVTGHQRLSKFPGDAPVSDYEAATDDKGTVGYGRIVIDGTAWRVRFVDWDEHRETAALIVANSATISGSFDPSVIGMLDQLAVDLPELTAGLMLDDLKVDLEEMFADLGSGKPDFGADDPGASEPPENPVIEPGQIYALGLHVTCPKCGKLNPIKASS